MALMALIMVLTQGASKAGWQRAGARAFPATQAGLYNDAQDLDLARTTIFLPSSVYNPGYRDVDVAIDGGELYGNLPISKAGALEYYVYGGKMPLTSGGTIAYSIADSSPGIVVDSIDHESCYGGQLYWHTPLEGLRLGFVANQINGVEASFHQGAYVGTSKVTPFRVWILSVEYLWRDWTFAVEAALKNVVGMGQQYGFTRTAGTGRSEPIPDRRSSRTDEQPHQHGWSCRDPGWTHPHQCRWSRGG